MLVDRNKPESCGVISFALQNYITIVPNKDFVLGECSRYPLSHRPEIEISNLAILGNL